MEPIIQSEVSQKEKTPIQYQIRSDQSLSRVCLFATPWTVAGKSPLSMGILQARILECVVVPSLRDLSNSGIKPRSPTLWADSLLSESPEKPISYELTYNICLSLSDLLHPV